MPSNTMSMPLSRITKEMTMTVTLTGTTRFRVGLWLFRMAVTLAAKIGGFGVKLDVLPDEHAKISNN